MLSQLRSFLGEISIQIRPFAPLVAFEIDDRLLIVYRAVLKSTKNTAVCVNSVNSAVDRGQSLSGSMFPLKDRLLCHPMR